MIGIEYLKMFKHILQKKHWFYHSSGKICTSLPAFFFFSFERLTKSSGYPGVVVLLPQPFHVIYNDIQTRVCIATYLHVYYGLSVLTSHNFSQHWGFKDEE
jgi:hypothetical protein